MAVNAAWSRPPRRTAFPPLPRPQDRRRPPILPPPAALVARPGGAYDNSDLPPHPLSANRSGTFASGWVPPTTGFAVMATADRLKKLKSAYDEYPEDMFADTRMSLGEHI